MLASREKFCDNHLTMSSLPDTIEGPGGLAPCRFTQAAARRPPPNPTLQHAIKHAVPASGCGRLALFIASNRPSLGGHPWCCAAGHAVGQLWRGAKPGLVLAGYAAKPWAALVSGYSMLLWRRFFASAGLAAAAGQLTAAVYAEVERNLRATAERWVNATLAASSAGGASGESPVAVSYVLVGGYFAAEG